VTADPVADAVADPALPTIYPNLVYRDCPAAIEWLTRVLGFTRHLVVPGETGYVVHAELRFGNGLVMVTSARDGRDWLGEPVNRTNVALVAPSAASVDEIHARVAASGARIVHPLRDSDFGPYGKSHGFTCLDAEDNRWSVGTYQPAGRAPA